MQRETIGRYQIKDQLGAGGMARVYLAHDPNFERDVAIKVLSQELSDDVQFRLRFEREAKAIARLEHSAIVPVYDVGEEDGLSFLVMRYMAGGTLAQKMTQGALPTHEIGKVIERIGAALDRAHGAGIIHRDVKPANILFDQSGDAYLSDFGIVKNFEETLELTKSSIIGTPAYMSPEQVNGDTNITGQTDLYALGVVLFEMLSGQKPFSADTPISIAVKHLVEPVPQISEIDPDRLARFDGVITRALAKKPADRYKSGASFAAALQAAISAENTGTDEEDAHTTKLNVWDLPDKDTVLLEPGSISVDATLVEPTVAPIEPRSRRWRWPLAVGMVSIALLFGWFGLDALLSGPELGEPLVAGPWFAYSSAHQDGLFGSFESTSAYIFEPVDDDFTTTIWAADFIPDDFTLLGIEADSGENYLLEIDPESGLFFELDALNQYGMDGMATGMAIDLTSDSVFVSEVERCDSNIDASLWRLTFEPLEAEWIGPLIGSSCMIALAINSDGDLYGFDVNTDILYQIDPSSAELFEIGSLGVDTDFGQGLDFDPATDRLYMTAYSVGKKRAELREVDLETGRTTYIETLGEDLGENFQLGWLAIAP